MGKLLRAALKGLLYLLVLPALLVVLALYIVVGLVIFIYIGIKAIVLFFSGRNIFGDLPEDIKAREILEGNKPKEDNNDNPPQIENTNSTASTFTTLYAPIDYSSLQNPNPNPNPSNNENKPNDINNNSSNNDGGNTNG